LSQKDCTVNQILTTYDDLMSESLEYSEQTELNYQRQLFNQIVAPSPTIIAVEGGPCGGKTTLLREIERLNPGLFRNFVVIPEVATPHLLELQKSGKDFNQLVISDHAGFIEFEQSILRSIVETIEKTKQSHSGTDTVIIIDRADIRSYLNKQDYQQILQNIGLAVSPIVSHVDKVIYLPTVAKIYPEKYNSLVGTNSARYENLAQAIDTCNRNLQMVSINPELVVFSDEDFTVKINRALDAIIHPEIEVESKFTADGTLNLEQTLGMIDDIAGTYLNTINIFQSYHSIDGQEFRLRHGIIDSEHSFYHLSIKTRIGNERQELLRNLSLEQYNSLRTINPLGELHKQRLRFIYEFEQREYVLALDYYIDSEQIVIEIEGLDEESAKRITIQGFRHGGREARELVQ
jgi:predicted ATPase